MNNTQQLPDLGKSFAKMRLQDAISENTDKSLFAEVCRIKVWEDFNETVEMIRSQMKDNLSLTTKIMGDKVINLINEIYE